MKKKFNFRFKMKMFSVFLSFFILSLNAQSLTVPYKKPEDGFVLSRKMMLDDLFIKDDSDTPQPEWDATLDNTGNRFVLTKNEAGIPEANNKLFHNVAGFTSYNSDYEDYCIANNLPGQETPWGFQEMNIEGLVELHYNPENFRNFKTYIKDHSYRKDGLKVWIDGKPRKINLVQGEYVLSFRDANKDDHYALYDLPSRTIIEGAGKYKTIFIMPFSEWEKGTCQDFRMFTGVNNWDIVLRHMGFKNLMPTTEVTVLLGLDRMPVPESAPWTANHPLENYLWEYLYLDGWDIGDFGGASVSTDARKYHNN